MYLVAILFCGLLLSGWSAARAAVPPPLDGALQKLIADNDRWAYSRTVQAFDRKGKPDGGLTIEHFDPSKHPDEQWTLRLLDGEIPSESDRARWRRQREREMRRRERPLGDIMELESAQLADETKSAWIYEVPIKPGASRRLPAEKFFVLVQVGKERGEVERVAVRIREGFRLNGLARVARLDNAEIDVKFAVVDPAYPAQPAIMTGVGSGSVAWVYRFGGGAEIRCEEYRRVKPYNDRFEVQIGEVKALDF